MLILPSWLGCRTRGRRVVEFCGSSPEGSHSFFCFFVFCLFRVRLWVRVRFSLDLGLDLGLELDFGFGLGLD